MSRDFEREIAPARVRKALVLTELGYLLAIAGNLLFPQIAPIELSQYRVGFLIMDMNDFYRLVLTGIIIIYLISEICAVRQPVRRVRFVSQSRFRFATGIALLIADILGTKLKVTPQPFFPGPAEILSTYIIEPNLILKNMLYSLRLFSVGFLLGITLGIVTGILIGWFPEVYYWVYPVIRISGVIPAVAWMPFALTLFPTPFAAAAFLIVITSWFPVASQTALGIQTTSKAQYEAARTLGASTPFILAHVAIPHAMPQVFTGISTACAGTFTCLVMAEMMGQPGGLGYYINIVKVWSAYYKVFAAIVLMAVLFSIIIAILNLIRDYVLRWQKGQFR